MARRSMTLTRTLVFVGFAAACGKSDDPKAKPTQTAAAPKVAAEAAKTPAAEPASEPTPQATNAQPSGKAGRAYFGVSGTGLVRIDATGGKARTLIEHEYPIREIVIDHRRTVYAAAIGGAWSITGDKVTSLPEATQYGYHEHLAVGPDGTLWTLDSHTANKWDGKAWTITPKATFESELMHDIAVDRAGNVWVATTDHLFRYDGKQWAKLDSKAITGTNKPYFDTVVAGAKGEVYVSSSPGVFVYEADAWRKVKLSGRSFLSMDEIVVGADGRVSASGGVDDVALGSAAELRRVDIKKAGAKVKQADVMAVDASGRTWLRTDNGVVILDADGKLAQQWAPGTVAGITGKIEAIAIEGNGPALPSLTDAAKGTVVGKVVFKGKPVAGAAVEICTSPASLMMFEKTPCTGSSVARNAVTAADGTFKLEGVPVGSYGFAVKPKKTWFVSMWSRDQCCTTLENGGTYDVGSINLDKLE
jgi:hypothetical protein